MSEYNCERSNNLIEISDSESEDETVTFEGRGTPFPLLNLVEDYNIQISELNYLLDHHLRFAVTIYTRLRWIMWGYEETGE